MLCALSIIGKCRQYSLACWHFFIGKAWQVDFSSIICQITSLMCDPLFGRVKFGNASKNGKIRGTTHINILKVVDGLKGLCKLHTFLAATYALLSLRANLVTFFNVKNNQKGQMIQRTTAQESQMRLGKGTFTLRQHNFFP